MMQLSIFDDLKLWQEAPAPAPAATAATVTAAPLPTYEPTPSSTDAMLNFIGGKTGNAIRSIFELITIAEEEIKAGQKRHRKHAEQIWQLFMVLQPTPALEDAPRELFRKHCRELCDRIPTGQSLQLATAAELLNVFVKASLQAPLTSDAAAAYQKLFNQCYPGKLNDLKITPSWPGREDEIIDDLRAKLTHPRKWN